MMSPVRLFVGLVPAAIPRSGTYVEIPNRFKPSPLNFIYRSLSGRMVKLEAGGVGFSFYAGSARSATEASLYRRLEALPQTRGRFRLNAVLPIAFDGLGLLGQNSIGADRRGV